MLIFIIVGLLFFLVGVIIILLDNKKKNRCNGVTLGKVVDIIKDVSKRYQISRENVPYNGANISVGNINIGIGNSKYGNINYNTIFYPVIEYQIEGKKYVKKSNIGSSSPSYAIGQEIEIYYNTTNPNEFYLSRGHYNIKIGIVFTILGIIFITFFSVMKFI